jgi:hypothetical protein
MLMEVYMNMKVIKPKQVIKHSCQTRKAANGWNVSAFILEHCINYVCHIINYETKICSQLRGCQYA